MPIIFISGLSEFFAGMGGALRPGTFSDQDQLDRTEARPSFAGGCTVNVHYAKYTEGLPDEIADENSFIW